MPWLAPPHDGAPSPTSPTLPALDADPATSPAHRQHHSSTKPTAIPVSYLSDTPLASCRSTREAARDHRPSRAPILVRSYLRRAAFATAVGSATSDRLGFLGDNEVPE